MEAQLASSWQSNVTAIGAIITPILVMVLTSVGWKLRAGMERRNELEDKLRDDRVKVYNVILEPFVLLLMSDAAWNTDPKNKKKNKNDIAQAKLLSLDYREHAFNMSLVGSDAVVKAYNNLMQHFYALGDEGASENTEKSNEVSEEESSEGMPDMLELLGAFLLEIRRSMGNESTELDCWDMLEWWLKDARELRGGQLKE